MLKLLKKACLWTAVSLFPSDTGFQMEKNEKEKPQTNQKSKWYFPEYQTQKLN